MAHDDHIPQTFSQRQAAFLLGLNRKAVANLIADGVLTDRRRAGARVAVISREQIEAQRRRPVTEREALEALAS